MQNPHKNSKKTPPPRQAKDKDIGNKPGPKNPKDTVEMDAKLQELFDQDGITPWRASRIAGCDYRYAIAKFNHFAEVIAEAQEKDWIQRNEEARQRALEGLSVKIESAKQDIKHIEKQIVTNEAFQARALQTAIDDIENSPIGEAIKQAVGKYDQESFMALLTFLRGTLDIHKSYGFLLVQDIQQLRADRIYQAELQQQYDAIQIMPPPAAVLEYELEKRIAAKQKLLKVSAVQKEKEDGD